MPNTSLSRTLSSGSATTTFTYSVWIKYLKYNTSGTRFFSATGSSGDTYFRFNSDGTMEISGDNSAATSLGYFITTKKFLDRSSWYHIVIKVDTTQATQSDRFKLYINGVQETAFGTATYPNQNADDNINLSGNTQYIGSTAGGQYFDGLMSQVIYCDNYAYDASSFGSTNATSGEWIPNPNPTVSYGTNGFKLTFEDTSALGDDTSGNTNDFTTSGSPTPTLDTPSNNFAVWNGNDKWLGNTGATTDFLSNGNTYFATTPDSSKAVVRSTIGVTSGKYYCEMKINDITRTWVGICNRQVFSTSAEWWTSNNEGGFFWYGNGPALYNANNQTSSSYGGYANGDIVMMALDMDNYAWYLGKNGTWLNSGDPTSGASKTGSVTEESNFGTATLTDYGEVFFMAGDSSTAGVAQVQANFGNGYFGTTAVSSAGTPGSTVGTFEYDVPTAYQPLTTKGINV